MSGVHEIFETAIDIAVRGRDEDTAHTSGGNGVAAGAPAKRKKRSNCKIL